MFILLSYILRGRNETPEFQIARHRLSARTVGNATLFIAKALLLLFLCIFFLTVTEAEKLSGGDATLTSLMFETISAFGTVGLSLGITSSLSVAGKLVIIFTMFAGRIGLVTMALPASSRQAERITYPEGEVLLG
jgi:trk system potassium uptake protein